jgi:hypothetical protein
MYRAYSFFHLSFFFIIFFFFLVVYLLSLVVVYSLEKRTPLPVYRGMLAVGGSRKEFFIIIFFFLVVNNHHILRKSMNLAQYILKSTQSVLYWLAFVIAAFLKS